MRSPLFQDVRVRRALAHAVDKAEVVKGALLGEGAAVAGPYKPGAWAYNDQLADLPYDPARAKALLAEAGWEDRDGDGRLDKDGHPFAFTILTNQGNDLRVRTATIIQSRLRAIGVDVRIRTVEWAAFIKDFIDKGKFDAVLLAWSIPQDPDLYDVWHSSKAVPGGLNHTAYVNPALDALLEKGRRTLDQAERKAVYDRVQEIMRDEQPYLFLYCPMALPILHARFQGVEAAPAGIMHDFIHWWVPRDRQRPSRQP